MVASSTPARGTSEEFYVIITDMERVMREPINLEKINQEIADRTDVFYWQTDRKVTPEQAGQIWSDRHRGVTNAELAVAANRFIERRDRVVEIDPVDLTGQLSLGNVNSVRLARLESGREVIIRCHPKGVRNGYFFAESAAAKAAVDAGLPSYETLAIHELSGLDDFSFQVISMMPGIAMSRWLEEHPEGEARLIEKSGQMMAKLHRIKVNGFGPFDNDRAKNGELVGIHETFADSVRAGLAFNLQVLREQGILSDAQAEAADKLFDPNNPLLNVEESVLVHNDFADWNLLTDGDDVTAILDWDECVASDPISDLACWSTFFEPERLEGFLNGYFGGADRHDGFRDKFELMRLRYTISKMTLRIRRYTWQPDDFIKKKIEVGKTHLAHSLDYFGIG